MEQIFVEQTFCRANFWHTLIRVNLFGAVTHDSVHSLNVFLILHNISQ